MNILEVIDEYNNLNTKYLEYITDFINSFNLDNGKNTL